jgi:voltage-gated potassium channel
LTARRAGLIIGAITLGVSVGAGLLMRSVDPQDFDSVGSGLWWSIQTITTVGYGDAVPRTAAGKALAVVVMVTALGFLSVLTASISAVFVESARRRRSRRDDATIEHIAERLDRIERRLSELSAPRP